MFNSTVEYYFSDFIRCMICLICAPRKKNAIRISIPFNNKKIRADQINNHIYCHVVGCLIRLRSRIVRCAVAITSYKSIIIANIIILTIPIGRPIRVINAIKEIIGKRTNVINPVIKLFLGSLLTISIFLSITQRPIQMSIAAPPNKNNNLKIKIVLINQNSILPPF